MKRELDNDTANNPSKHLKTYDQKSITRNRKLNNKDIKITIAGTSFDVKVSSLDGVSLSNFPVMIEFDHPISKQYYTANKHEILSYFNNSNRPIFYCNMINKAILHYFKDYFEKNDIMFLSQEYGDENNSIMFLMSIYNDIIFDNNAARVRDSSDNSMMSTCDFRIAVQVPLTSHISTTDSSYIGMYMNSLNTYTPGGITCMSIMYAIEPPAALDHSEPTPETSSQDQAEALPVRINV